VTNLLPNLLRWADLVGAVGSTSLYRTLSQQMVQTRFRAEPEFLYGLLTDGLMGCGMGACLSCAIETTRGPKLACIDGPVFDLATLDFS
jgi:dihydroorotate dehydrogenase electron transfer subunit